MPINLELSYMTIGIIAFVLMAIVGALVYLYSYYSDIKDNFSEIDVHLQARKRPHPPIIDIMDASGGHRQFIGVKEKPQKLTFKNTDNGVILDPRRYSKVPQDHKSDGAKIFTYCTTLNFPIDNFGGLAVSQTLNKIRKEYPELDFIKDDFVIMELLTKPQQDLDHDIRIAMKQYSDDKEIDTVVASIIQNLPEDTTEDEKTNIIHQAVLQYESNEANKWVNLINEIKGKMKVWGIEPGFYSLSDAISKLPFGTTVEEMQRAIALAKLEQQNDSKQEDFNKWFPVLAVCAIMGTLAMAYMVMK